jgi:glycosyltransferase involved in cell wall biosynthesis
MKRTRVAIVSDYFPPVSPGGAELSTFHLARGLAPHVDIEVITTDFGARPQMPFYVHYIPLSGVPTDGSAASDPRSLFDGGARPFSRAVHYAQFAGKLAWLARKRDYQVIHTQQLGAELAAYLSSPVHRKPRLTTLRGYRHLAGLWQDDAAVRHGLEKPAAPAGRVSRFKRSMPRAALRSSAHTFTVSEFVRRAYVDGGLLNGSSSSAVFNVMPHSEPSRDAQVTASGLLRGIEGPVILYAGRLTAGKGLEMLIDAMPDVIRGVPEARLVVVGGGERSGLEKRAAAGLAGYAVRFTGHLENGVTLALVQRAAVVAVPSLHHEPLGRVLLEAISTGVPVVATPYGGTPEVVTHGENGLLLERVDAQGLAAALVRALTDSGLPGRARDFDAELRAGKLNPEKSLQATLDVYEKVIAA